MPLACRMWWSRCVEGRQELLIIEKHQSEKYPARPSHPQGLALTRTLGDADVSAQPSDCTEAGTHQSSARPCHAAP